MNINLQNYDIDSKIYMICQELDPSPKTRYILHSYKFDYSNMLSQGEVPFIFKNGKVSWNVDIKTVTIGDIINTFYSNDDGDDILNVEANFCKAGDIDFERRTSKKEFFIKWKDLVKNWGGMHLKKKDKRTFKRFINQKMVSPMSVMQAIYINNDYSIGEFAFKFSCDEKQAVSIMKCLGYKNINDERNYLLNTEFQKQVEIICNEVNGIIHFYKHNQHITSVRFLLRDVYKRLASFFERRRDDIALEIDCTAERVEPAHGERVDWLGFLEHLLLLVCAIVFAVSVYFTFQQMSAPDKLQFDPLITLMTAVISAIVAFVLERWTVKQNFKIDYHNERLKVMPVFSVKCFRQDEFDRYKREYKAINQVGLIIENHNGHKNPMYVVYNNIGDGIAFETYIYSCSINPEPIECHTMAIKDSIIVEFEKGCYNDMYISYRDLYGNLYQQYIKITVNELNENIEAIEQPPELIMRTKRARYIQ